jgi:hypothetical protein
MKKLGWVVLGLAQAAGLHALTWFVRMPASQAATPGEQEIVSRIVTESYSNGGVGAECGSTCEKQCRKNCAP